MPASDRAHSLCSSWRVWKVFSGRRWQRRPSLSRWCGLGSWGRLSPASPAPASAWLKTGLFVSVWAGSPGWCSDWKHKHTHSLNKTWIQSFHQQQFDEGFLTTCSNIRYTIVRWNSLHRCWWTRKRFDDISFIPDHQTISCYQWACSPVEWWTGVFGATTTSTVFCCSCPNVFETCCCPQTHHKTVFTLYVLSLWARFSPGFEPHVEKSVGLIENQHVQTLYITGQVQTIRLPPEHVLQTARSRDHNVRSETDKQSSSEGLKTRRRRIIDLFPCKPLFSLLNLLIIISTGPEKSHDGRFQLYELSRCSGSQII